MPFATKELVLAENAPEIGARIDRAVQTLTGLPRSQVLGLFDHDCVTLNGEVCHEAGLKLVAGYQIAVRWDTHRKYHPKPRPRGPLGFEVVFEDKHLIVVNKPPHLLTVPTDHGETNTLVDKVSTYVRHIGKGRGAFVCHRLDRGVSGLLVFGKTQQVSDQIRDQFEARKPQRRYVALVAGLVKPAEGTFRTHLATAQNLTRYSTEDEDVGQLAITHYRVVRHVIDTTLVEVWLETGRRNQIRVHFSEAGHPVLGDERYRPEDARHPAWPYERLALHAWTLGFDHPVTGEPLAFQTQLPHEFNAFLRGVHRR